MQGVGEHDGGLHPPVEVDQLHDGLARFDERVVPEVEELDLGAQSGCRGLGLFAADGLDLVEPLALHPLAGGLAPLAVGQAGDHGTVAPHRRGRDRAPGPPHEIARMGADHQQCALSL